MTTATYHRYVGKTGRPLGLIDVLGKLVETAGEGLERWAAARRAAELARSRAAGRRLDWRDAASVRRMADGYRMTDPGFAADLYAAVDRHEQAAGLD